MKKSAGRNTNMSWDQLMTQELEAGSNVQILEKRLRATSY